MSLKKAVEILSTFNAGEDGEKAKLYDAITECHQRKYHLLDLYAAVIAMEVDNVEAATHFVNGPSNSEQWGGSGEGALAEIQAELKARLAKKRAKEKVVGKKVKKKVRKKKVKKVVKDG